VVIACLEALIDGRQPSAAVVPGGPCGPSLLAEDLLGTTDGAGDVVAQQGVATGTTLVVGEATAGRRAPVVVVDLEDSVVVGSVVVLGTHHPSAVGALMLGNAGPLVQLVTGNAQVGHLPGQGATVHGAGKSWGGTSHGNQNDESLHNDNY